MVDALDNALAPLGLRALGDCPDEGSTITLIGPDEPAFWGIFHESPEYHDGAPDPLDRWSVRALGAVARELGAEALFPFSCTSAASERVFSRCFGVGWLRPDFYVTLC